MQFRNSDSDGILAKVREHDAARQLNPTQRIRANAKMEQIMATNPTLNPTTGTAFAKPKLISRHLALRLATIPVAAAAIVGANALLPIGPAGPQPAFASWTALPAEVDADRLGRASAACLASLQESLSTDPGGPQLQTPVADEPFAAEQRGNWISMMYAPDDGRFENCIVQLVDGEPRFERGSLLGAGMIATSRNRLVMDDPSGFNPGFTTGRGTTESPGLDGFGSFAYSEDEIPGEGQMSTFFGEVGSEITGVVIHLPNGEDVVATVTAGMMMAWWPTPANTAADLDATRTGIDPSGIDFNQYISGLSITLVDGTTREISLNEIPGGFNSGFGVLARD